MNSSQQANEFSMPNVASINTSDYISINQTFSLWFTNIILYNIILILVIIVTIIGNIMVIMSVILNKNLQSTTNLFLMSLAAADFLVAVVVMPIYVLSETIGYFPFGFLVCNLWLSSDIFLCTSSIWHMCTISMDRYFTIKFPFKYGRNKSRKYTFLKIAIVWVISIIICSSMFALGMIKPINVYDPTSRVCALTNSRFKLYGSVFAFFIPLTIVVIMYAFTMYALKKLMQSKKSMLNTEFNQLNNNLTGQSIKRSKLLSISIMSLRSNPNSTISKSRNVSLKNSNEEHFPLDGYKKKSLFNIPNSRNINRECCHSQILKMTNIEAKVNFQESLSNENEHSAKLSFVKIKKLPETSSIQTRLRRQSVSYTANNERKAQKVLIIMFIIFVSAWSPFFIVTIISAICPVCNKHITPNLNFLITWLGYLSSMANPIIYTMFNKKFRRAFVYILRCQKIPKSLSATQSYRSVYRRS